MLDHRDRCPDARPARCPMMRSAIEGQRVEARSVTAVRCASVGHHRRHPGQTISAGLSVARWALTRGQWASPTRTTRSRDRSFVDGIRTSFRPSMKSLRRSLRVGGNLHAGTVHEAPEGPHGRRRCRLDDFLYFFPLVEADGWTKRLRARHLVHGVSPEAPRGAGHIVKEQRPDGKHCASRSGGPRIASHRNAERRRHRGSGSRR